MLSKTKIVAVVAALAVMGAEAVSGCSSAETEPVGSTSEALEAGFIGSSPGAIAQEVVGAWSPAVGTLPETVVIGYNDFTNFPDATTNQGGWAFTTNEGANWSVCNVSNPGGCNGDGGVIAGGLLGSDPTMIADHLGNVVYVKMGNGNGRPSSHWFLPMAEGRSRRRP